MLPRPSGRLRRHVTPWPALGLVLVSVACAPTGDPDQPSSPDDWSLDRAVVLVELRDSSGSALYRLDRATGIQTRVTPSDSRNWAGRPSPEGARLLFISKRDGNYELYVSTMDGADARNVTRDPDYDVVGAWSPDGSRIAFMSTRGFALGGDDGPFPGHGYVAGADGTGIRQVTRTPLTSSLGPSDWSSDGRWLAIAREVADQADVYLLDVETGDERRVTSDPASEYAASLSHDGRRIAFHADDGASSSIVVVEVDGSNRRVLTDGDPLDYEPRWSPDDEWLLVTRRGAGDPEQYDVVAVRVSDGFEEPIAATSADERGGGWVR